MWFTTIAVAVFSLALFVLRGLIGMAWWWAISAMGIHVRWALFIVLCFLIFALGFVGLIAAFGEQPHAQSVTDEIATHQ